MFTQWDYNEFFLYYFGLLLSYCIFFEGNKIYWTDAKTDKIEKANLDGTHRTLIYDEPLAHDFGLTLFQNFLYYTDWTKT